MNLCDVHKAVAAEVKQYLLNVPTVNEESITDYLVWKWRLLDSKFNCMDVRTHSHHKESTTSGADFEMELWLIGRELSIPLLFQAKKLVKPYDGYVRKLRYPNNSKRQLALLLKYARRTRRLPFYAFYAVPDYTGSPNCNCVGTADCGVFVAAAHAILAFANGKRGRRVSKGALLGASQPFYCWYCCTSLFLNFYLNGSAKFFAPEMRGIPTAELPAYAKHLLLNSESSSRPIGQFEWPPVRRVATYDMRQEPEPWRS